MLPSSIYHTISLYNWNTIVCCEITEKIFNPLQVSIPNVIHRAPHRISALRTHAIAIVSVSSQSRTEFGLLWMLLRASLDVLHEPIKDLHVAVHGNVNVLPTLRVCRQVLRKVLHFPHEQISWTVEILLHCRVKIVKLYRPSNIVVKKVKLWTLYLAKLDFVRDRR